MGYLHNRLQKQLHTKHKKSKRAAREPLFSWPDSARQFEKKVKEFGYHGDDDGVCHGVACVAAHAMLLNQVDQFDQDLLRIRDASPIPDDYQHQYEERSFLEAVEVCHQPDTYREFFPTYARNKNIEPAQHPLRSLPLVESIDISNQGGIVSVGKFSGVYDRQELIQCLQCLRAAAEKFARPMAIMLSDDGHIVSLQYDLRSQVWIFVDLRSLPSRQFDSEEAIARAIAKTLTPNLKKTVISGMLFASQQNAGNAKNALAQMMRSRAWRKTQGIDHTKMRYLKRWLFMAAYDGCEQEVAFLLANNVDPNGPVFQERTPLMAAAYQGNVGVAKLLLSNGARVNDRRKRLKSSLFTALEAGHDDVADLLRAHGARFKSGEAQKLQKDAAPPP